MKAEPTKAIIYTRWSPRPEDGGSSEDTQIAECRRLCEIRCLTVIAVHSDRGISGKVRSRPGLEAAIAEAKAAGAVIVAYSLSRYARNVPVLLWIFERCKQAGVGVLAAKEQFDFSSLIGKLVLTILGGIYEFQLGVTAEDTSRAMSRRIRDGIKQGGQYAPLGMREEGGRFVLDIEEAAVVREITDSIKRGDHRETLREMRKRGVTIRGKMPNAQHVRRIKVALSKGVLA